MNQKIVLKENLTNEELILIQCCLLTTKDILNNLTFKSQNIKNNINKIDKLLKKFSEN